MHPDVEFLRLHYAVPAKGISPVRESRDPQRCFIPLTLEMGSWLWVKKNPRQLFSRQGIFNPLIGHRQQRVLRRHGTWLDFVMRAVQSHARWQPDDEARAAAHEAALSHWYRRPVA